MREHVLADGESIVIAFAESASGPGWANTPVWVIIRGRDGTLRQECIQPEGQPAGMLHLYHIANEVTKAMNDLAMNFYADNGLKDNIRRKTK